MQDSDYLAQWIPGPPRVIDLGDNQSSPSEIAGSSTAALRSSESYYPLDSSKEGNRSKKRKVERACDFCRRRKTKCDGPQMHGTVCTNCIQNGRECTYMEASKPRGPPKAYVTSLEDRLERADALLKRLRPEADFSAELGPPLIRDSWKTDTPPQQPTHHSSSSLQRLASFSSLSQSNALIPPTPSLPVPNGTTGHSTHQTNVPIVVSLSSASRSLLSKASRDSFGVSQEMFSDGDDLDASSATSSGSEDYGELSLVRGMQNMSLGLLKPLETQESRAMMDSQWRFHGKSSSFKLIHAARKAQQNHMNELAKASRDGDGSYVPQKPYTVGMHRRPEYWTSPPWEMSWPMSSNVVPAAFMNQVPPLELAHKLIDFYFDVMNAHFPLLHRPTFDRQFQERLYEHDIWFMCLCMAIFGLGSRWCKDPRVLTGSENLTETPDPSDEIWNSAGWKYIHIALEIHDLSPTGVLPPYLLEVQTYPLIGMFLRTSSLFPDAWTFVSIGIRKAQDIGAHRKKVYGRKPTVEEELWKRAYWHLITFDRIGSMILGRPCAGQDEDLDLDMPLEVDEEYWENDDPSLAFQQPSGKPCKASAFNMWIKLTQIAAFALRTLYAVGKSRLGLTGPRWKEDTVARLNAALSAWVDEIPEHLRWKPVMKDRLFTSQATTLITTYYMVVIVAHRPFIPVPSTVTLSGMQGQQKHDLADRPDFPWSCLSICANAAKASSEILEIHVKQDTMWNFSSMTNSCYICAGVLLVHIWVLKALEKAEVGGGRQEEIKKVAAERMADLMGTLNKLIARLETLATKIDIARLWLDEIKESMPSSPDETESSLVLRSVEDPKQLPISHIRSSTSTSQYHDFLENKDFFSSSSYPPFSDQISSYENQQQDSLLASSSNVSVTSPTANSSFGTTTNLSRAPYTYDLARTWQAPRPMSMHLPGSRLPTTTTYSSLETAMHRYPVSSTPVLRNHRSTSDIRTTYDSSTLAAMDPCAVQGSAMPDPPWVIFQRRAADTRFRVKREREDTESGFEDYDTPAVLPPFHAPVCPSTSDASKHQGMSQTWEGVDLRSRNDRRRSWRGYQDTTSSGYPPSQPMNSIMGPGENSFNEELRNVGFETLYTAIERDQRGHGFERTQPY